MNDNAKTPIRAIHARKLVKQYDGEWLLTNSLAERADRTVAATNQPLDGPGIGVFAHVKANNPVRVLVHELRQRLCHFGLADSGGTNEQQ